MFLSFSVAFVLVTQVSALRNVSVPAHGTQLSTSKQMMAEFPTSNEEVTSELKFHVSGKLDVKFVKMVKSFRGNPHLNQFSTMLDAKVFLL